MVDADTHPAAVVGDVVDTIGYDLAEFLVLEVVDLDTPWLAFGLIIRAAIAIIADQLFFLVSTEMTG